MPAYNEEANICNTVEQWYPIIDKYGDSNNSRLIVVNDGSTDRTKELGDELMREYPKFIMLTKKNGGHGDTLLFAYQYAINNKADYIFQTDSDGQTNPDEFDKFWLLKDGYAAVIGDRQSSRQDGKARIFIENVVRFIIMTIFHVSVPDANAPFRLMKTQIVEKYIKKIPEHFFLCNVILTTYFVYFNEPVKFVPISFKPRGGGENSINFLKIVKIGLQAVKDFIVLKRHIND